MKVINGDIITLNIMIFSITIMNRATISLATRSITTLNIPLRIMTFHKTLSIIVKVLVSYSQHILFLVI
jgi:hypothetical protein